MSSSHLHGSESRVHAVRLGGRRGPTITLIQRRAACGAWVQDENQFVEDDPTCTRCIYAASKRAAVAAATTSLHIGAPRAPYITKQRNKGWWVLGTHGDAMIPGTAETPTWPLALEVLETWLLNAEAPVR